MESTAANRNAAIEKALLHAAEIPLETARLCVETAELAATTAATGNSNAVTDAAVAALLAEAGCKGAAYNVRVNVAALADRTSGAKLEREAVDLVTRASRAASRASEIVELALKT
jgi:glutamate formiminotransferase/formiminotetrahydrofolate cyclodeaminase